MTTSISTPPAKINIISSGYGDYTGTDLLIPLATLYAESVAIPMNKTIIIECTINSLNTLNCNLALSQDGVSAFIETTSSDQARQIKFTIQPTSLAGSSYMASYYSIESAGVTGSIGIADNIGLTLMFRGTDGDEMIRISWIAYEVG